LRKQAGIMEGLDYRDVRVLAAWRTVPGTVWSIVAKVDVEEVDRPVRELSFAFQSLGIALGLASTLFLVLRLRQLARHNRAEREALVSHYGYLARYANDIILLLDGRGNIVEANDRATEAYGYTRHELLGLEYRRLSGEAANPRPLNPGEGLVVESLHRRKDGTPFPVEASIRSIQVDLQLYTQCILRDISERRKAEQERRRLEEQLARVHRQEAVGRLAGGVAHDLNNALTAIRGYGELLKMKLPAGSAEAHPVEGILTAVTRAASVTHGLLAYSEQQVLGWEPVELNSLVSSARPALERALGPDVLLEIQVSAEPLVVRGDPDLLRQVLLQLAGNSRSAMPQGGRFTLSLEASGRGAGDGEGTACLSVRDTGTGMSEEVRSRLFEPFFTTQGFGRGAGLGLPMVFGIVRQHGGRIEVDSEHGGGTELRIHLPLARPAAEG
jgi:PAS domain S-box-containing protein